MKLAGAMLLLGASVLCGCSAAKSWNRKLQGSGCFDS